MLLRARIVLPITAPPIEDGAVLVSGERILEVGPWRDLRRHSSEPPIDLGPVALLPGFIDAHCHLDYTHFAGHLPPQKRFTDWIQGVLALKAGWSFSEYAASWIAGAQQLLHSGCTTVLDIEAVPELLPEAWESTPLRVISALEMTGVRSGRPPEEIVATALNYAESLEHERHRVALSPHAPYSTRRPLLELASRAARERGLLTTMHVAESAEEFEMFRHASGAMHDWLLPQRGPDDCGRQSPVRYVAETGLAGPDVVLAHVNYLEAGDAALLGNSGTHVVHCPRSHAYFGHAPFPFSALRSAGVNVCLGTDSVLSMLKHGRHRPELDMLAELETFACRQTGLPAEEILAMATVSAARAIGRAGVLGEIRPGAFADLIAVKIEGPLGEAAEQVVRHRGGVAASLVGGRWALSP